MQIVLWNLIHLHGVYATIFFGYPFDCDNEVTGRNQVTFHKERNCGYHVCASSTTTWRLCVPLKLHKADQLRKCNSRNK